MGLIKAITGAAGGVLADQWKEFIYCESMPADVLVHGQLGFQRTALACTARLCNGERMIQTG